MKKITLTSFFGLLLAFETLFSGSKISYIESCTYKRENISYRENKSFNNTIAINISIPSNEKGRCETAKFNFEISSKKALLSKETDLLSFLIDEYLAFSQQITSSSNIAYKYINIGNIIAIQNREKKRIEELVIELGFDISLFKSFVEDVANNIAPLDIYCLDVFTVYYKYELDKLKIYAEYNSLFEEYQLQTDISKELFKNIINIRGEYLKTVKKIFITSLVEGL